MQINIYTMVKALQKKKCVGNRPRGNEIIMLRGKKNHNPIFQIFIACLYFLIKITYKVVNYIFKWLAPFKKIGN